MLKPAARGKSVTDSRQSVRYHRSLSSWCWGAETMSLWGRKGFLTGAVGVLLAVAFAGSSAQAQNAFCPTGFGNQTGISFSINECTNGNTGAYSNSALASQSLTDLSQSSTEDTTKATMASVSDRRRAEEERCPDGFSRVDGTCRPAATASRFAPEPAPGGMWTSMPTAMLAFAPPNKAFAAMPVIEQAPRFGVWSQAYGDYERRTGRGVGIGEFSVLTLDVRSTTWSGGVLGGRGLTSRNLGSACDGLITVLLAGYI